MSTEPSPALLTPEQRYAILRDEIARQSRWGWAVESQTETSAVLVKGKDKQVSHLLHLVLTLLTCGLWGIVWIVQAAGGGGDKRRLAISVGYAGEITKT